MLPLRHLISSRSPFLRGLLFLAIGAVPALPLSAQLHWEKTQIHQDLSFGQQQAEAVFAFENAGDYPIEIQSTSTSCGCTTAELEKTIYNPGERGEIKASFDVGGRTGSRRNTVQVHTDDPANPSITLVMEVEIPTLLTITPRLIQWRVGSAPEEKTVLVQLNPEADLKITGIESDNEDFNATLTEGDNAHEYRLTITPVHTKSSGRAVFSLQTEPKNKNQPNFSFYAFVR